MPHKFCDLKAEYFNWKIIMHPIQSPLHSEHVAHKRVLLRADLNVPLKNGSIISDKRLKALMPTLNLILEKNGKIILLTHIDRPEKIDPSLSTKILIPWLTQHGYSVAFESDLNKAYEKSFHDPKTILLIENLRFLPGEKTGDTNLAKSLARLGDLYVNDAFGMIHRTDCSVVALPQLFPPHKRIFGLLIEKELKQAQVLLKNPAPPYTLIIGGNKIRDKIPLMQKLLPQLDFILLCPAIVFTFLHAQNRATGDSLVDQEAIESCKKIIETAKKSTVKIVVPTDYVVSRGSLKGPYMLKKSDDLSYGDYGITIGPETQILFANIIKQSKSCLYNGLMGDLKSPESLQATQAIFQAMIDSKAYSVIGGGDSTAAAELLGFSNKISYLSTGGGALVAYLSGAPLPALELVIHKQN